jgi:hypothetical protein
MTNHKKVILKKDIQTVDGFLKKGSKVRLEDLPKKSDSELRVTDATGRIFWIDKSDLAL